MIHSDYDLLICGGGPAGIGAAIAAGRRGLRVLLIERSGCLGGVSTSCALPFWLGCFTGSKPYKKMLAEGTAYEDLPRPRRAVAGIFQELCDNLRSGGYGTGADPFVMGQGDRYPGLQRLGCHDEFTFNVEDGKRVLEKTVLDAGVTILYYSQVCDAEAENGILRSVTVSNKRGLTRYTAPAFLDCTGDGDVVAFAGGRTSVSPVNDTSSVSLIAHIEGIDSAKLEAYLKSGGDPFFREACQKAREENPGLDIPDHLLIFPMVQEGVFMVNGGTYFVGYDALSPEDMTALSIRGRERARILAELVFPKIPGGEHARVRLTGAYPGVRETRRILSEGALTEEHLLTGHVFPDPVALAPRHFDLERGGEQPFHAQDLSMKRDAVQIPYSCMVPKDLTNVLAAGRCVQADGQALGPARIMATCFAMGEAAGLASVIRQKRDCAFREVPYVELREMLLENGAILV